MLLALWAGGVALLVLLALAGVIMSYEWVRLLPAADRAGCFCCGAVYPVAGAYMKAAGDALRLLLVLSFILGGLFWFFRWRITPVVGGMVYLGWLLAVAYFRDSASGGCASVFF